jgi:hypothetical protein
MVPPVFAVGDRVYMEKPFGPGASVVGTVVGFDPAPDDAPVEHYVRVKWDDGTEAPINPGALRLAD